MKLAKILLSENTQTVNIKDFTWDTLTSSIGKISNFGIQLPSSGDTSTTVFDEKGLDLWKDNLIKRYGDVQIKIDPLASNKRDVVKILDDKFISDKERYSSAKGAWLDKERQAGRTSGLD